MLLFFGQFQELFSYILNCAVYVETFNNIILVGTTILSIKFIPVLMKNVKDKVGNRDKTKSLKDVSFEEDAILIDTECEEEDYPVASRKEFLTKDMMNSLLDFDDKKIKKNAEKYFNLLKFSFKMLEKEFVYHKDESDFEKHVKHIVHNKFLILADSCFTLITKTSKDLSKVDLFERSLELYHDILSFEEKVLNYTSKNSSVDLDSEINNILTKYEDIKGLMSKIEDKNSLIQDSLVKYSCLKEAIEEANGTIEVIKELNKDKNKQTTF